MSAIIHTNNLKNTTTNKTVGYLSCGKVVDNLQSFKERCSNQELHDSINRIGVEALSPEWFGPCIGCLYSKSDKYL